MEEPELAIPLAIWIAPKSSIKLDLRSKIFRDEFFLIPFPIAEAPSLAKFQLSKIC